MDRDAAVAALPEVYAELLRLREAGTDRARIAALLEVEVEALDLLLRVAEAKLALLLAAPRGATARVPLGRRRPGRNRHGERLRREAGA